jgi:ABC-type transport system substrate-binding protein
MIAESWQWSDDSSYIKFNLRDDIYWSDGEQLTTDDVIFSYDVYSDPEVQSRLFGTFDYFYSDLSGQKYGSVGPWEGVDAPVRLRFAGGLHCRAGECFRLGRASFGHRLTD